jgi:hypothetical protein
MQYIQAMGPAAASNFIVNFQAVGMALKLQGWGAQRGEEWRKRAEKEAREVLAETRARDDDVGLGASEVGDESEGGVVEDVGEAGKDDAGGEEGEKEGDGKGKEVDVVVASPRVEIAPVEGVTLGPAWSAKDPTKKLEGPGSQVSSYFHLF